MCTLGPMSCDKFLIDITQAFLKSPVHTNKFSFENVPFSMRFENPRFQWKRSQNFIVLVCRTKGEKASQKMRFQMKTYWCGRGLTDSVKLVLLGDRKEGALLVLGNVPLGGSAFRSFCLKWSVFCTSFGHETAGEAWTLLPYSILLHSYNMNSIEASCKGT